MRGFCIADDECLNPVFRGELCRGHYAQLERKQPLAKLTPRRELMTPLERLLKASTTRENAGDNEADYKRAVDNLCKAALGYAVSLGYTRPQYRKPSVKSVKRPSSG